MKPKRIHFCFLALAFCLSAVAQGTVFTYQGRLNDGAISADGSYDLTFALFDAASGGTQQGGTITNSATAVTGGLFTTSLDFGDQFPGADRWLEISVRTNGATGFTPLAPRQKTSATPYAVTAGNVTSANVARLNVPNTATTATGHPVVTSGFITGAVVDNGGSGYLTAPLVTVNDATGSGALIVAQISNGSVVSLSVSNAGLNYSPGVSLTIGSPPPNNYQVFITSNFFPNINVFTNPANSFAGGFSGNGAGLTNLAAWQLTGNAGTAAGINYIGTTDNQPLELRVNNRRALRIEPKPAVKANVMAGSSFNTVSAGAAGATISGGGDTNLFQTAYAVLSGLTVFVPADLPAGSSNQVASDFATVAGGVGNSIDFQSYNAVIGGGIGNQIDNYAASSVIAGGVLNEIQTSNSFLSVISGGMSNVIGPGAAAAVISGGQQNTVQTHASQAAIGGGQLNTATGSFATVPGGDRNSATNHALAAGHRAKANHDGAFVWADSTEADFGSTGSNQFLIRASGGVGIGTASPQAKLHVAGPTVFQGLISPPAAGATNLINLGSGVTADGFRNGISFFEAATAAAMSLGYDGTGDSAHNALRVYHGSGAPLFSFQANGSLGVGTNNPQQALHVVGNIVATGTITGSSDRNAKEHMAPVNPREVLDKVAALTVSRWNYKADPLVTHLGPMAQDFHAAFGLGTDDKHISMVDADGVALAAIQGLNAKLEVRSTRGEVKARELEARLAEKEVEITELRGRLEKLERLLETHRPRQ